MQTSPDSRPAKLSATPYTSPDPPQAAKSPQDRLPLGANVISDDHEDNAKQPPNQEPSPYVQGRIFPNAPIFHPNAFMKHPQFQVHGKPDILDEMATSDEESDDERMFLPLFPGRSRAGMKTSRPERSDSGVRYLDVFDMAEPRNGRESRTLAPGTSTPLPRLIECRGPQQGAVPAHGGIETGMESKRDEEAKPKVMPLRGARKD